MHPMDLPTHSARGTAAHPATLLALAIGIAVGALLSGAPARGAEDPGRGAPSTVPSLETIGPPKRVQTVPVLPDAAPAKTAAAPFAAAPTRYDGDDAYRTCLDKSDGTNPAWNACGEALIEREDVRLNEAWSRVYAPGSEAKSQELLTEQRAWITFKEASCTIYLSGRFGREGEVLSFPVCRAGIIADRTAALDAYGDPEGR